MLSSESLDTGGVFLLENGYEALLHLDKHVQPEMVHALLGIGSYDELMRVPQPLVLLPREDAPAKALQEVLVKVRDGRCLPHKPYAPLNPPAAYRLCAGAHAPQLLPAAAGDAQGGSL